MMPVYDPHIHIQTITIVGIGGTGANVARIVGRMLYDLKRRRRHGPELVLVDPDVVEAKNIGRQMFSPSMLGRNKAESIGKLLNLALGLSVSWIPEPVDAQKHVTRRGSNLIISCVDHHEARQILHAVDGVLIGAGNETHTGQVCIGDVTGWEQMQPQLDGQDGKYHHLPKEGLLFPELLQPDPTRQAPTSVSCAEQMEQGEQSLLINDWVANVVGGYVYKLLHRIPITTFLTFINTETLTVTSKRICREELAVYRCREH